MPALIATAVTLMLVGAIMFSLERHRRLTPITAVLTGLSTLAIVGGAIMISFAPGGGAVAETPPVAPVSDLQLPTI